LAIAMKIGWSVYKILNLAYTEPGIGGRRVTWQCRTTMFSIVAVDFFDFFAKTVASSPNWQVACIALELVAVLAGIRIGRCTCTGKRLKYAPFLIAVSAFEARAGAVFATTYVIIHTVEAG